MVAAVVARRVVAWVAPGVWPPTPFVGPTALRRRRTRAWMKRSWDSFNLARIEAGARRHTPPRHPEPEQDVQPVRPERSSRRAERPALGPREDRRAPSERRDRRRHRLRGDHQAQVDALSRSRDRSHGRSQSRAPRQSCTHGSRRQPAEQETITQSPSGSVGERFPPDAERQPDTYSPAERPETVQAMTPRTTRRPSERSPRSGGSDPDRETGRAHPADCKALAEPCTYGSTGCGNAPSTTSRRALPIGIGCEPSPQANGAEQDAETRTHSHTEQYVCCPDTPSGPRLEDGTPEPDSPVRAETVLTRPAPNAPRVWKPDRTGRAYRPRRRARAAARPSRRCCRRSVAASSATTRPAAPATTSSRQRAAPRCFIDSALTAPAR